MSVPESFAGLPLGRLDGGSTASRSHPRPVSTWQSPEGIEIKPRLRPPSDLEGLDALDT